MSGRLKSLDILRGVAAASVVLHHTGAWSMGEIGVDLFFVISGFVMANVARGRTATEFLQNRFWRIYPIYWIALIPWLLIALNSGTLTLQSGLANLMLFPLGLGDTRPFLFLAWTLIFELLFYSAVATAIRLRTTAVPMAIYGALFVLWGLTGSPTFTYLGNPLILEFLLGVAIAQVPRRQLPGGIALLTGLSWLTLFPGVAYSVEFREFLPSLTRLAIWGVPCALITYGLLAQEQRLRGNLVSVFCGIGVASYSIYLFHPLVTAVAHASWMIEFVGAMGLGIGAWYYLEKPIMEWRMRMSKRRERPALCDTDPVAVSAISAD